MLHNNLQPVGVVVALLLAICLSPLVAIAQATAPATASTPATTSAPATQPSAAVVIKVHGVIDEYSADQLFKRFGEARAAGAKTIILELNTPGGLVKAALDITRFLRMQEGVRTIAYVENYALSAGTMIAMAADELVMAPQSKIGDSAPIAIGAGGGLETLGATERAKAESPILADFLESSLRNGYDPLLTSAMVTVGRVVHFVENDAGERKFVDDKQYPAMLDEGWRPVPGAPDPVDQADTLLTVQSDLAQKLGLSKGTFGSPEALAQARGLNIIATLAPSGGESFIALLGSEMVRGVLMSLLMLSIYFAFSHPGHGWPEAIAVALLGVVVGVPVLTGFASWWEVAAILLGLALLGIELFVIPGFGVTGIAGLVLLFGGLVLTFVGSEPAIPGTLPALKGTWSSLQRGLTIVTVALVVSLLLWMWISRYLPKLPYFNRLILTNVAGDVAMVNLDRPIETGPAVGDVGVAITDLKPGGSVKFITESYPDGRIAGVVSESGYVRAGTRVSVHEVAGNRVVVRAEAATMSARADTNV